MPNLGRGERKRACFGEPKHAEKPFLVMEKQCTPVRSKQSFGNAIALIGGAAFKDESRPVKG
jgi:hypothetical protein